MKKYPLDCLTCGACCTNPDENRSEGFLDYVEVPPDSPLLRRNDLAKRYLRFNDEGVPHMRLDPAHRCVALRGRLGESVKCAIYPMRPNGCRQVSLGSARCLQYRKERGLEG